MKINKQLIKKILFFMALVGILIGATFFRSYQLDKLQPALYDELSWFLVGTSLVETGEPSSWMMYEHIYRGAAKTSVRYLEEKELNVFTPYVDHPPLFSLMIGFWAKVTAQSYTASLDWQLIRVPLVALSIATIIMAGLLINRIFRRPSLTFFTVLGYAFFPSHIIATRFIAAEHLIAFLLVTGLYLVHVSLDKKQDETSKTLALLGIITICIASLLVKLSAVAIPLTLFLIYLLKKKYGHAYLVVGSTILSLFLFYSYFHFYDWPLFLEVLEAHKTRAQSLTHFWTIFTNLDLGYLGLYDPSVILGMIGFFLLTVKNKLHKSGAYFFAPLLAFSFVFSYVAPEQAYGWYKYAIYPLLGIGLGYFLERIYKGDMKYLVFFLPLCLVSVQTYYQHILQDTTPRLLTIAVYALAGLGMLVKIHFNKIFLLRIILILFLITLLYFEVTWTQQVINAS